MIPRRATFAFTLIEVLVAISIITLLVGILLPCLAAARERGQLASCLANSRSIGTAMAMYLSDDGRNLPWFYIHGLNERGEFEFYPGVSRYTSFSWGGMLPASSHGMVDAQMTPAELRPFSRYLCPEARGFDVTRVYVCPSDKSAVNPDFGPGSGGDSNPDNGRSNWREYGTSYSINWHWLHAYAAELPQVRDTGKRLMEFGPRMLQANRGGNASRLIWNSENHFDQMMNAAGRVGGTPGIQGGGWHGKFSMHTAMFLDGHAEHLYLDTRFVAGPGWAVLFRTATQKDSGLQESVAPITCDCMRSPGLVLIDSTKN